MDMPGALSSQLNRPSRSDSSLMHVHCAVCEDAARCRERRVRCAVAEGRSTTTPAEHRRSFPDKAASRTRGTKTQAIGVRK
jgi:hypothetical protein